MSGPTLAAPAAPDRTEPLPAVGLLDALAALYLRRPTAATLVALAERPELDAEGDRIEAAVADYHALFLVPVSGRYLPPFESAQRQRSLRGRLAHEVSAAYDKAGFDVGRLVVDEAWGPRPAYDHVGCELAFVAALEAQASDAEPTAAEALRTTAAAFWRLHPASWLGPFGRAVTERATTRLYRSVGERTTALV
jgi:putative dimethyl sulfoxide reductase chaperone